MLTLTFLTVFACMSCFANTVVVAFSVTPAEATVSTWLQYTWILHLRATKTSNGYDYFYHSSYIQMKLQVNVCALIKMYKSSAPVKYADSSQ